MQQKSPTRTSKKSNQDLLTQTKVIQLPCYAHIFAECNMICTHYQCNSRLLCQNCVNAHNNQHKGCLIPRELFFAKWQKRQLSNNLMQLIAIRQQFEKINSNFKSTIDQQTQIISEVFKDLKTKIIEVIDKYQKKQLEAMKLNSSGFIQTIDNQIFQIATLENQIKSKYIQFHEALSIDILQNSQDDQDFNTYLCCKINDLNEQKAKGNLKLKPNCSSKQGLEDSEMKCLSQKQICDYIQLTEQLSGETIPRFLRNYDQCFKELEDVMRERLSYKDFESKLQKTLIKPFKDQLSAQELVGKLLTKNYDFQQNLLCNYKQRQLTDATNLTNDQKDADFVCKKSLSFSQPISPETGNYKEIRQILFIASPQGCPTDCLGFTFNFDNNIKIVRLDQGTELCSFNSGFDGIGGFITNILQLNERNIVFGCQNGQLSIWDLQSKKIIKKWQGHKGSVLQIQQYLMGQKQEQDSVEDIKYNRQKYIITVGSEGIIRLWDLNAKQIKSIRALVIPANQEQVQIQQQNWNNIINGIINNNINVANQMSLTMRFFQDANQRFILILQGNRFLMVNADVFKIIKVFRASNGIVYWNVDPQTKNLIALTGKHYRVWNIYTGNLEREVQLPNTLVNICTVTELQDGTSLACINQSNELSLLNKFSLKVELNTKLGGKKGFHYISYLKNGKTVAVSSSDGKVKLWDFKF